MFEKLSSFYQRIAARRMFSAWAEAYEADVRENAYAAPGRVAAAILPYIASLDDPLIVDAGIGTGLLAEAITGRKSCRMIGLDNCEEMLAKCRLGQNKLCDIGQSAWPVKTDSADAVVSAGVFEYLTEPMARRYLLEAYRVLKHGGHTALSYVPAQGQNRNAYWRGKDGTYLCCSQTAGWIEEMLRLLGFTILQHDKPFKGCRYADGSGYDYRVVVAIKA